MTADARLSPDARADLRAAAMWIRQDSARAADRFRRAVTALARLIGEHPLVGVQRPELAGEPYRFAVVTGFPYLVVYDSGRRPPVIARIVHGARDLPEVLRDLSS